MSDAFALPQPDLADAIAPDRPHHAFVVIDPQAPVPTEAPAACLSCCLDGLPSEIAAKGCAWLRAAALGEPDASLLVQGRCPQAFEAAAGVCELGARRVVVISVSGRSGSANALSAVNRLQSDFDMWSQMRQLRDENDALAEEVLQNYEKLSLLFDFTHRIAEVTHLRAIESMLMERLGELLRQSTIEVVGRDATVWRFDVPSATRTRLDAPTVPRELIDQTRQARAVMVHERGEVRWMLGPLKRLDEKMDVVAVRRSRAEDDFTSGDVQLMESLLMFGGQLLSNNELHQRLRRMSMEATRALVSAIDKKDHYTFGHSERVGFLARMTGEELGVPSKELGVLEWAGLLHDVGKIGVPEEILSKPGRLTDEEFEQIKKHPEMGYEILQPISDFEAILSAVLYHHENPDGSGYPHGLKAEDIPLFAAIIHVVDVFDALTSRRSYRDAFSIEKTLEIMRNEVSQQKLDERVANAFFKRLEKLRTEEPEQFAKLYPPARSTPDA